MVVDETYRFDDESYRHLGAAGVGWQSALDVLHARPRLRQHLGGVLRVAAADRDGRWLTVALVEEGDDGYLVVSARDLSDAERATVRRLIGEGGSA
ncbi:hypothetical protein [Actinocatenispora thailandica]|nr:hypothetical protein [Actinocatenispora thailandica]